VLWIRGDSDLIVSDQSALDLAVLGQMGAVPGYPGPEVYPSQPMLTQLRTVLDRYQANGGNYEEVVLQDCAHSPHIEKPDEFLEIFSAFLSRNS
jgi:pimeloyl-ACP methyl ester carboxylesterase